MLGGAVMVVGAHQTAEQPVELRKECNMPKRVAIGIVISDKAAKTRRVEIPRLVRHPRYGKYLRRRTICYVHDEQNASHAGDVVEIIESRPRSRLKRWELVRVVEKGRMVDLAAMRAALRARARGEQVDQVDQVGQGDQLEQLDKGSGSQSGQAQPQAGVFAVRSGPTEPQADGGEQPPPQV